jgi:hypothetical protein
MLNSVELNFLLEEGRKLQAEIGDFIKTPTTVSSQRLITCIDKLISDIKPQLLAPSYTENNELGLLITNLGSIVKNLNDVKATIKTKLLSPFSFFQPKGSKHIVVTEKLVALFRDYTANLNRFENIILATNTENYFPTLKR